MIAEPGYGLFRRVPVLEGVPVQGPGFAPLHGGFSHGCQGEAPQAAGIVPLPKVHRCITGPGERLAQGGHIVRHRGDGERTPV